MMHGCATSWDEVAAAVELVSRTDAIELVGPHGYIHGWIKVDSPAHSDLRRGMNPTQAATVTSALDMAHAAATAGKHEIASEHLSNALNRARYFSGSSASLQATIRAARTQQQNKAKAERELRRAAPERPHALQGAMSERNADNTLKAAAHGRPVKASDLAAFGGRPAVGSLLAAGHLKQHPTKTGYVVITPAGRSRLASLASSGAS